MRWTELGEGLPDWQQDNADAAAGVALEAIASEPVRAVARAAAARAGADPEVGDAVVDALTREPQLTDREDLR